MTNESAVLDANGAFYNAFATGDFAAMKRLWSTEAQLTCAHPGWPTLIGREPVLESWRNILDNDETSQIACSRALAFLLDGTAYVTCQEHVGSSLLVATNIFVNEAGAWRMCHHQAGAAVSTSTSMPAPATLQ